MNLQNALIVIESPNKREKIAKITGAEVYATKGHFKTLSKEIFKDTKDYEPIFEFSNEDSKKHIFYVLKQCENKEVYIATDPDREGYGIAYLFYEMLKNKNVKSIKRAEFFEITESGIQKGIQNAIPFSQSNFNDFESFKARVVGDKLVGFILSPKYTNFFTDKISVGRVQTPALSLIVKRQKDIESYQELPLEQKRDFKIKAKAIKNGIEFNLLNQNLYNKKEEAQGVINRLDKEGICYEITHEEVKNSPKSPLRTSQLQEQASKAFEFDSEKTMKKAQILFEKGLITYHRTDSNALSKEFLDELEKALNQEEWYQKREYKAGKQSQAEAHEAIRITHYHHFNEIDALIAENKLGDDEKKLYTLIYQNTISSQAKDCINKISTYAFNIRGMIFNFKNTKCLYKGYKGIFEKDFNQEKENEETQENQSQSLNLDFNKDEKISIISFECLEVKKQSPNPYKESNFITLLEKEGIGRPSTYASFLPKLLERNYVVLEKKNKNTLIIPTPKGISLIKQLEISDSWITKSEFTKTMEGVLDSISKGEVGYLDFIRPLHEKMEFINPNEAKTPSKKQIEYMEKLAKEQQMEIPKEAYESNKICNDLIAQLKKSAPKKPPSEKQIKLAEDLAKKHNLELPEGYKEDYKVCVNFIDKCFKKNKENQ